MIKINIKRDLFRICLLVAGLLLAFTCGAQPVVGIAAGLVWKSVPKERKAEAEPAIPQKTAAPSWSIRMLWLASAFVPSGLMLAVTNHILLNLASVPFLWILPLAVVALLALSLWEAVHHDSR